MNRISRPIVVVSVTLFVLIVLAILGTLKPKTPEENRAARVTQIAIRDRVYSSADLNQYSGSLYNDSGQKSLSDKDFRWIMTHLNKATAPPTSNRPGVIADMIDELDAAGTLTSEQKSQAQEAVIPLLSENDEVFTGGVIQEYACKFYEHYPYRPAVTRLVPLLNSPHQWVRYHAALALRRLDYNVVVPPRPRPGSV